MKFPADLTGGTSRLALWDAEATGTLAATAGRAEWTALAHANEPVMRFAMQATGSLDGASFVYVPEPATNPRAQRAQWTTSAGVVVDAVHDGTYRMRSPAGGWAMFFHKGQARPEPAVAPVQQRGAPHRFGRRK